MLTKIKSICIEIEIRLAQVHVFGFKISSGEFLEVVDHL